MLELKKTAIALDEKELMKLEEIVIDGDEAEALPFLKQAVSKKILWISSPAIPSPI